MFLLFLHPAKDVAQLTIYTEIAGLPKRLRAGQVYLIPRANLLPATYSINGQIFTELPSHYLFSPGLYNPDVSFFTATIDVKKSVFGWPEQQILLMPVDVKKEKVKRRSRLNIPKKVWQRITTDTDDKIAEDREKIREAYQQPFNDVQLECWRRPLSSKVVSRFGSPRELPNGKSYFHSGLDLRARSGTPIKAAASGEVLLAEHMVLPGNTVLLSHGGGLYSRYMHLSRIDVKPGEVVRKGQLIGLAGATGRVEAAHLHWEVLWKGNHVSPLQFLQVWEQICDPA